MRAFVFTDPALASEAGRFVWLDIDVEKKQNAAARKTYDAVALPTYMIVNPSDGAVLSRRVGGMSVAQLQDFLRAGETALAAARGGGGAADSALARAERAYAVGDYAGAADAYVVALAKPPADPAADARAVEAALFSLSKAERPAEGLAVAEAARARFGHSAAGASATAQALDFALALPDTTPGRAEAVAGLEAATRAFVADTTLALADDDRSGMLATILSARQDAKDAAGAKAAAEAWLGFLLESRARMTTAEQRTSSDGYLVAAAIEAGDPARALPALQASERDLPEDYNPPARLAAIYNSLKRWDEAQAAARRSLAKAYGPRKLRVYSTMADAQNGAGDVAGARATLDEGIAYGNALPEEQRPKSLIASLAKKRDGLATN